MELDERFGRAANFAIVEAARAGGRELLKIVENTGREASGAAGTGAVQILANEGVEGIVAPHLGPKAEEARKRLGMKLWSQGEAKTLDEALSAWAAGELENLSSQQAPKGLYRA